MPIIYFTSTLITLIAFALYYNTIWKKNKTFPLLPRWFNMVSVIILSSLIVLHEIFNVKGIELDDNLINPLIIISLLLFCFTADKNENKSYMNKRLIHLFISITIVTITFQITTLFKINTTSEYSSDDIIMVILITYLLSFHYFKKRY